MLFSSRRSATELASLLCFDYDFFIEEAGQGFDASYFRMLGFNKWDTKEWDTV